MLPSKIRPATSPLRLTRGEPELPPMMALVVTTSNGVPRSSFVLSLIHESGSWNGSAPVARSNAPAKSVNGLTGWAPLRPALDRAVRQAQRERGVRVLAVAVDREARLGEQLLLALHRAVDLGLDL